MSEEEMISDAKKKLAEKVSLMTRNAGVNDLIHHFTEVSKCDPDEIISNVNTAICMLILFGKIKFVEEEKICLN